MDPFARIGGVVSPAQTGVHVVTEGLALALVAPWSLAVARNPNIDQTTRRGAWGLFFGTLLIDGALFWLNLAQLPPATREDGF